MSKSPRTKASTIALGLVMGVLLGVPVLGGANPTSAETMPMRGSAVQTAPGAAHRKAATSSVRRSKPTVRKFRKATARRAAARRASVRRATVRNVTVRRASARKASTRRLAVRRASSRAAQRVEASVVVLPTVEWMPGADATLDFEANDGLGFANWSGEGLDASVEMLTSMFGTESVCANNDLASCDVRRGAKDVLTAFNQQITFGRCEGMVAMVGMAIEAGRSLDGLGIADVEQEIVYWSLSQLAPRVVSRMEETRMMEPSRLATEIADDIRVGRTSTLAMWGEGFAHSVLPVAVEVLGTEVELTVWDPNFPDQLGAIRIDISTETWTYGAGVDATGALVTITHSGAGRLGFVENELRAGPHSARFAD